MMKMGSMLGAGGVLLIAIAVSVVTCESGTSRTAAPDTPASDAHANRSDPPRAADPPRGAEQSGRTGESADGSGPSSADDRTGTAPPPDAPETSRTTSRTTTTTHAESHEAGGTDTSTTRRPPDIDLDELIGAGGGADEGSRDGDGRGTGRSTGGSTAGGSSGGGDTGPDEPAWGPWRSRTDPASSGTQDLLDAGMIRLQGSRTQPMGLDPEILDRHLEVVGRTGVAAGAYERALLVSTPAHTVPVEPFLLSKYEVTNAQWRLFLMSTEQTIAMPSGETLARLAEYVWKLEGDTAGKALQQGWMYLMERNWDVLQPVLNPTDDPDWEPLFAKAGDTEIPEGLELSYTLYMPPPQLEGDPTKRLVVVDGQENYPARYVSWEAAVDFCRWAGLHVPRERELEHAMRGVEGRLYSWSDEWQPWRAVWRGYNAALDTGTALGDYPEAPGGRNITGPLPVDTLPPTGAGFHHLQGNVSEWALEPAQPYADSECKFIYWNTSRVARGGSFDEFAAFFHAADRTTQGAFAYLPPTAAEPNRGLRPAAYALPGQDLTVGLMEPFHTWALTSGPHQWHPIPPGLSKKDSGPDSYRKQQAFKGFDDTITAGWIDRQVRVGDPDHAFIRGPAQGIAVLPAKGFAGPVVRDTGSFRGVADAADSALLVGVLTGTDHLGVLLDGGDVLHFGDERARTDEPYLARRGRALGYFLVLEGERVAVYEPNPARHGSAQAHLTSRKPLGHLREPWQARRHALHDADGAAMPATERSRGRTRLRFPLRELDADGRPLTGSGAHAIVLEIVVDTTAR